MQKGMMVFDYYREALKEPSNFDYSLITRQRHVFRE